PRHLHHQIAARPAHPIKHDEMTAGLDPGERLGPALVDQDGANGVGFTGIFRAVLAPRPGRADAADEIERGVELFRELSRDLAVANAEGFVVHGGYSSPAVAKGNMDGGVTSGNRGGEKGCPAGLAITV